jgi:hypothetical protein
VRWCGPQPPERLFAAAVRFTSPDSGLLVAARPPCR